MRRIAVFIGELMNHTVVRGSAVVLAGSMVANVLAYAYHLVVGRLLGPVQYGEFTALLSLFYIINVGSQVLQTSLAKFFSTLKAKNDTGGVKTLFTKTTRWILILAVGGLVFVMLVSPLVAGFLHITNPVYFVWLYIIFISYLVTIVPISAIQAYQKFVASSILVNTGATIRLIFGALGAQFNVGWVLLSNIASNTISYVLYLVPLRFLLSARAKPISITKKNMLSYSIPTLMTTLGLTALYSQDVLLVKHFFSAFDAGVYSSLSVLGKVIYYSSASLGFVLFPVIAERNERQVGHHRMVMLALLAVGGLSFALTTLYFLFPETVVHLLFGEAFSAAVPLVGWFGLFISFFTMASILISVTLAAGLTRVWVFTATAAIFQFLFLWFFHSSLFHVIIANLLVAAALFSVLLIYYNHAKKVS